MLRYMIRKEFFGAYVYDSLERMYLLFDSDSYDIFVTLLSDFNSFFLLEDSIQRLLKEQGFILEDNSINYYIIDNGNYENVLSAPMRLHFLYTNDCNLNCIHCFSKSLDYAQSEMTFQQKTNMLDEMKSIGICEILIGGGEPFIQNDIFDFIRACNERDIVVKIFTNGLVFSSSKYKQLLESKIAYLAISMDGASKEEYKRIRGVDGFDTIMALIKKLKNDGCAYPILISTTISHYNCHNPKGFLDFMKESGADRLKIRATKPNGNINAERDVMVDANEYLSFLMNLQYSYNKDYSDLFRMDITWGDFRLYYDNDSMEIRVADTDLPYDQYGCVAGKTAMCINADGVSTPCGFLPDEFKPKATDSILSEGILGVWHNSKSFNALRNMAGNDTCKSCEEYNLCRGGCVARCSFYNDDPNSIDPWCIKKFFPVSLAS